MHDHEYERTIPEVVKEYKTGILDPARLVGKMEIKGARKK
jgi:hypothetical protein